MKRLLIHVEGQTEERFVDKVLAPHLCTIGFHSVSARLIGNSRKRSKRGGVLSWQSFQTNILLHLKNDPHHCSTMMVDFYALPASGNGEWPGRSDANSLNFSNKATRVEQAVFQKMAENFSSGLSPNRFIPYISMHEFEALLFSDCKAFATGIGKPDLESKFQEIRDDFTTPEEINDSPVTAPCKRIEKLVPGYRKPLQGSLAALEISLDVMRRECPHFNQWLVQLEHLCRD